MFQPASGEPVKFAGNIRLTPGQRCKLIGEWIEHPRFGKQFKTLTFEPEVMTDEKGLSKYIADNPRLKGLGPIKAKRLVKIYGAQLESTLADISQRIQIATLLGVAVETINCLAEEWEKDKHLIGSKSWLASFGLTNRQISKLIDRYGPATKQILTDNPYLLIHEIDGWGFKRVDDVALAIGYPKNHKERIRAAIIHCLKQEMQEGHCWVGKYKLYELANRTLFLDYPAESEKIIYQEIDLMVDDGLLYYQQYQFRNEIIALPSAFNAEKSIFDFLAHANEENSHRKEFYNIVGDIDIRELNIAQKNAFFLAIDKKITLLTGGAGTGKTFAVKKVIELYDRLELSVKCCALAGKAAKRLEQITGHSASTIHRLLEFDPVTNNFLRSKDNPIDADLVIVDEFSMVDIFLANDLFSAIDLDRTAVLLVGDHNQLPSIGAGAILRDLTNAKFIPTTILTEMMRQSGELERCSNKVLEGVVVRKRFRTVEDDPNKGLPWLTLDQKRSADEIIESITELTEKTIQAWGDRAVMDLQIITPMRKGEIGINRLNRILQHLFQTKLYGNDFGFVDGETMPSIFKGDKVIYNRNNRRLDIYNGTMGIVQEIDVISDSITVDWDDGRTIKVTGDDIDDIDLAYALTIHKTQGSEFPIVIVVCYRSHQHMLHRNLLYTAVTRAQKSCVIIGDQYGIKIAAERMKQNDRNTFLPIQQHELAAEQGVKPNIIESL